MEVDEALLRHVAKTARLELTQNEIDEFIKKQGYNETVQLADKVKEYVKTWDEIHPDTIEWINRKGDW